MRFDYTAGKFMTGNAAILHVAARDLEVGAADAGDRDADDTLARRRDGVRVVAAKLQMMIECQGAHSERFKQKNRREGYPAVRREFNC